MLHQKTTQNAIAAMSRLAELYDSESSASSSEIAEARNLPQPLVAKVLTTLARAGLIKGSPGPGGGYRLAARPATISLWDIVQLFERQADSPCPFGPGWCGNEEPCPLHHTLLAMREIEENYLKSTTFSVFQGEATSRPAAAETNAQKTPKIPSQVSGGSTVSAQDSADDS